MAVLVADLMKINGKSHTTISKEWKWPLERSKNDQRKVYGRAAAHGNSISILMGSVCSSPSVDVVADSKNEYL